MIAFCFLLKNEVVHRDIWTKFFNGHKNKYNIYSHIKQDDKDHKIPEIIRQGSIPIVETQWCGESLIIAFANMLKRALKNKKNKYFVLVSGECIPLYPFDVIYKKLFSDPRSRMDISERRNDIGSYYYASQWMSLNRDCAELFIDASLNFDYLKYVIQRIGDHCPDEIYPIYFFINSFGPFFSKEIINKRITYTKWKPGAMHPVKFNKTELELEIKNICKSDALFARKFHKSSARKIAMKC